jgi:SPP1 gp7 family putative phage head morphogenesis protein
MKFEQRSESIAWHALLRSYNLGLGRAFSSIDIKKFIWVTPQSEKNCKVCNALNGVELSEDDIKEVYPAHPNCTCHLFPKI